MDLKLKDLDGCKKEFDATLTYEDLKPHFEKALQKYRQKVTIPGFRKGKAPLKMIERQYGDSIEYSALEDIANEVFKKYILDKKVEILDVGRLKDMDYKPKEKFTFQIEFEVRPEVVVENYKNIELTRTVNEIDDSIVDEEIQNLRMRFAQYEIDGQALDNEYRLTVDIQNLDDGGNIIIGESQKDVPVYLGDKNMFPEFKEGLKNIKEEEQRIIETKGKDDKPKKVQMTCKKVEKIVYPDLNEEFFKKVTSKDEIKTEKEFRDFVRKDIETAYKDVSERAFRDDVIHELVKLNDVSVPDLIINNVLDNYVQHYKEQFPKNYNFKDFKEDEFRKQKKAEAIVQAKWFLIREKLIEMEKFKVTDDDYKKIAEENSEKYNIPVDKLIETYKNNDELTNQILSNKVMDFLIENAKVKEKKEVRKAEGPKKVN